ncbi:MAG: glycosyltransferase family 2 protein [Polyangiaceae bacterium]
MSRPTLTAVIPIFNEESVIPELHKRLQDLLSAIEAGAGARGTSPFTTEVVFVDDGSKDASLAMLRDLSAQEPRYRVVSFARNFGHQRAITAGIDYARGEAVVVMDADLQDPPEVVVEMVQKWREGFDVVYGKRRSRQGETFFKLLTAKIFYRTFAAMIPIEVPLDTGDFRLMSRKVVLALRSLREAHRFVRGMVSWVGFRQTAVLYDRHERFAGETKYPLSKMIRFAIDGITSFSVLPLRFSTYLGMFVSVVAIAVALWAVVAQVVFHATVPGWTAIVVLVALLAAAQLLMIGILGEYIGRIYEQVKERPLYVVKEKVNLAHSVDDDSDDDEPATGPLTPLHIAVPNGDDDDLAESPS